MTTITRERLLKIQQWRETYGTGSNVMLPAEEAEELARIALTAMQQEPVERVTADQMQRVCMEATRHIGKYAAMAREVNKLLRRTTPPAPVMPAELHPDTQNLVADFCTVLAEKLYKAQLKYGYDADWKQDGWHTQCLSHFHQHIAKGDPRDVAAYCAFMWYHGWKTESISGPVVPEEMPKGLAAQIVSLLAHNIGDKLLAQKIWNACRAVMLQSKYRDLSQPVDPQISEYEKIMLRAGWVMVPIEPTDEMIVAAMDSDDVTYNESDDTVFYVHHREIYKAMLAAAPQQETANL